jgi:hypothetical protein
MTGPGSNPTPLPDGISDDARTAPASPPAHPPQSWGWLRWFAAEIAVVVTGVLIALALNAWWGARADRAQETRILQGILADLNLDVRDLESAMNGARARALAADDLLGWIDDPDAGLMAFDARFQEPLDAARALAPDPAAPSKALAPMTEQFRFDVTDATISEAIASGQWRVVRDPGLRRAITLYYTTTASFGRTPDDRVETHAQEFRRTLAAAGLAPTGTYPDEAVLATLRGDRGLVAELKNLREHSLRQLIYHTHIDDQATTLIEVLVGHGAGS